MARHAGAHQTNQLSRSPASSGNSLIGASPGDIHRSPGATTRDLPLDEGTPRLEAMLRRVVPTLLEISREPADSVADVRRKEAAWSSLQNDAHPLARWKDAVSLWCAQWFWPAGERRPSPAEIRAGARALGDGRDDLPASKPAVSRRSLVILLVVCASSTGRSSFPMCSMTLAASAAAGFDAVIGNLPWEMVRRQHVRQKGTVA